MICSVRTLNCQVIATSAVPKIKPLSLIPVMLAKLFKKEGVRPQFTFKEDQMPEQVGAVLWQGSAGRASPCRCSIEFHARYDAVLAAD